MELSERISLLRERTGKNISQFAHFVGFKTAQAVRELEKGNTKNLSESAAMLLMRKFPEISEQWLRYGEGDMMSQQAQKKIEVGIGIGEQSGGTAEFKFEIEKELVEEVNIDDNAVCKRHYKRLKVLLEKANREIARLEGKVEEQDKFIKMLLDRK